MHELLTKDLVNGDAERSFSFSADKNIPNKDFRVDDSYYQDTDAYEDFRFDKGHMACAADFKKNNALMKTTFTYANAIPQNSDLNRHYWKELE